MDKQFNILKTTRQNILSLINVLNNKQLNHIPRGFKNNIAWNLGHIIVTQQLLHYKLSGNELLIDIDYVEKYRKGTKPTEIITDEEIDFFKEMLPKLAQQLEKDYHSNKFNKPFNNYTTSYHVELNSIEDAIQFNNVHEGMHLGFIKALLYKVK